MHEQGGAVLASEVVSNGGSRHGRPGRREELAGPATLSPCDDNGGALRRARVRRVIGLVAALIAALAGASGAQAASLAVSVNDDAAEDRRLVVTATGTADGSSVLEAIVRNAGGAPCAATRPTDIGGTQVYDRSVGAGTYSETSTYTADDPRQYLLCAWLRRGSTTEATASLEFSVRSNAATLALELPAAAIPDEPVVVTARGTTEVSRLLRSKYKPAGGAGCGSASSTDTGAFSVFDRTVSGAFAEQNQRTFAAGAYLFCAWVQESGGDLQPEATASATISVQPPDRDGDGVPDATDRCPTRAGTGATGCPPRVAAASFTAKASPRRDRRAPYRFRFSGRLVAPAGIPAAEACRGNVAVQIKRGSKTISTRRRGVRRDCTWRSSVAFARRSRVGRSGGLNVSVRFLGNDVLLPRSAKKLRIRAG